MRDLVVAVDVGTGSARAGVFDTGGRLLGRAEQPIDLRRDGAAIAEQDSENIWRASSSAVRAAVASAGADPGQIRGISFDATCSLVVRDSGGLALPVGDGGEDRWDTIAWFDHRALAEARECSSADLRLIDELGGAMSPEMQIPKLMWLKRRYPDRWQRVGYLFDLVDFLTWRATGSLERSNCTLACKWAYQPFRAAGWPRSFLDRVGLADLVERGRLPEWGIRPGASVGTLTPEAAGALGLTAGTCVGAGLIDAHAGALGMLGRHVAEGRTDRHLALIAGTSSCVMGFSTDDRPMPGLWGPFHGAVFPDLWVIEGGQSATGALLDHIVRAHGAGGKPDPDTHRRIAERIADLLAIEGVAFAADLHVVPDFHGNRSPLADPFARGVISGLALDPSFDGLCRLYWRTAVGIALGLRHILETMVSRGFPADTLHVTGGHSRNPLLMELYANATGCRLVEPRDTDAVLLGTAMLAATSAGIYPDLRAAAEVMASEGAERQHSPALRDQLERDYRIYLTMLDHRRTIEAMAR